MNDRVALEALDTTLYGKLKSNPLPIPDTHISRSNIKFCCFLLKFLEDISGGTDTAILDFWCIPHFCASLPMCNEFLRFTSGATLADLFDGQYGNQTLF